jgi:NADH:ubiquinone oxidoreductase subunit 3 (subunit A)
MSFALAAVLEFLALAIAVPAITLGAAVLVAGRPAWVRGPRATRPEPGIQTFLMLAVLTVVDLALVFLLPWAAAFGGLPHTVTAVEGLVLAVLTAAGAGYAWRRGVLRWQ